MSVPVAYPFIPSKPDDDGVVSWRDVEFLYTVKAAKDLEEIAGTSPYLLSLRGQSVKATVLMVWHGLKHADASMNENKAVNMLQRYLDAGGKLKGLNEALVKAMNESGVYGEPDVPDEPEREGEEGEPAPDPFEKKKPRRKTTAPSLDGSSA